MSAKLLFTQDLLWMSSSNLQHVPSTHQLTNSTHAKVGTGVGLVFKWSELINSFHTMEICLTAMECLHPQSSSSCCTGTPVPSLTSPRPRGRRWLCTRPWQRGVRWSCTHLCQGQIEGSQFLGKNLNRVSMRYVFFDNVKPRVQISPFLHSCTFSYSSYSNLKTP